MKIAISKLYFFCVLLFLAGCSKNPATNELDFVIMDEEKEYSLGREIRKKTPNSKIYKNLELQKYLNDIAQKVYLEGERPSRDLTFYLINEDSANAFATPGYVFFNRGILPYLIDEAALTGIIAHEIGHINARHAVKTESTDFLTRVALNSIIKGGSLAVGNAKSIHKYSSLAYSRHQEDEADELALRYLNGLEIPSSSLLTVFKFFEEHKKLQYKLINLNENRLYKEKEKSVFLSTHPAGEQRVKHIESLSKSSLDDMHFYKQKEYYDKIDGLEYGYHGSQGQNYLQVVEDYSDIIKSQKSGVYGFKNIAYFKSKGLKMTMPKKYQARVMSQDPVGYNYNNDIKVSVLHVSDDKVLDVLDIFAESMKLPYTDKEDLVEKMQEIAKKTQQKADVVLGEAEHLLSFSISDNFIDKIFNKDNIYYYVYAKQLDKLDEFGNHDGLFDNFRFIILSSKSKKSFDEHMLDDILFIKDNLVELNSKEKSKIKPLKIKIYQAKGYQNIHELSKDNTPYIHFEQEWFKLINGIYDDTATEVRYNQLLKLIPNPNKDI